MQWRVAGKNNSFALILLTLLVSVVTVVVGLSVSTRVAALTGSAGSVIGATICGNSSSITLIQPVSDSVVTSPTVALQGVVHQTGQVEVRVDGMMDSIIPISVGQTTFGGSVQLSPGNHTISLTAINMCSGSNAETSVVITYTVPPQTPSSGSDVPTDAGGVTTSGVSSGTGDSTYTPSVMDTLTQPLQNIAEWLNIGISTNDVSSTELGSMHIGQAAVVTAGMALAVIGVSPAVVAQAISLPVISGLLPFTPTPQRILFISRGGRIVGLLLIFGTLFL